MTLKDRIFTGLLAVFSFIAFYPQYVSAKIIGWMDMMFYFLPFRMLPAELLRSGVLPLWNPYIYCGQPLMANMQSAVLYPPDMLFYVLPPEIALKALTFAAFFLMSFFMYMFMRLYKTGEEGSLLAAFLLVFTYYMTVKAVELADLNVMVWMPAALYFTKKFSVSGKLTDLVFISFMLSLSFLGGHPQVFVNVYLLFAAYYFFENFNAGRKGYAKAFVLLNAVLALIVMMQALPAAEFVINSKRMSPLGMGFEASAAGFMKLEHLAEMFFPFISSFLPKQSAFLNWMGLIDVGVAAIFLAVLGAAKIGTERYRLFLLSVFTAAFFISFMGSLPFYRILWAHIGFLKMIRFPAKINLLFFFAICVMAGHGFDLLFRLEKEKLKKFTAFILASGAAVLLAYVLLEIFKKQAFLFYKNTFNPGIKLYELYAGLITYDLFVRQFMIYTIAVLASVFILYLAAAKGVRNAAVKYALLAAALVCPFLFNSGKSIYTAIGNMTSAPDIVRFLKTDKDLENRRVLAPGIINQLDFSVNVKNEEDLFSYHRDIFQPNLPMYHKIFNADGFDSLVLGDFFTLKSALNSLEKPWDDPAFSLLNVKYISSIAELHGRKIKKVYPGIAKLYEYKSPSGPAYFVAAKTGWPDREKTQRIGESEVPLTSASFMGKNADNGITFKWNGANAFDITAKIREKGTLVVSENYFPGWNAYENGKKLDLFKANVCFMAVSLDEGLHSIIFKYEPIVFTAGACISTVFLCLLAAAGMFKLKSKSTAAKR